MARVPLLELDDLGEDEVGRVAKKMARGGSWWEIMRVVVHSTNAGPNFFRYGSTLADRTSVPPMLREILILHAAKWAGSDYVWHLHELYAGRLGMTEEVIAQIARGEYQPADETERATLELGRHAIEGSATDDLVTEASKVLTHEQAVDVVMTALWYGRFLPGFIDVFDVALEPGIPCTLASARMGSTG